MTDQEFNNYFSKYETLELCCGRSSKDITGYNSFMMVAPICNYCMNNYIPYFGVIIYEENNKERICKKVSKISALDPIYIDIKDIDNKYNTDYLSDEEIDEFIEIINIHYDYLSEQFNECYIANGDKHWKNNIVFAKPDYSKIKSEKRTKTILFIWKFLLSFISKKGKKK